MNVETQVALVLGFCFYFLPGVLFGYWLGRAKRFKLNCDCGSEYCPCMEEKRNVQLDR